MATFKKKHIKIYQNATVIFDGIRYVCVDGKNTYSEDYFYHRDRNSRSLKVFEKPDGTRGQYITLGLNDTVMISDR